MLAANVKFKSINFRFTAFKAEPSQFVKYGNAPMVSPE